MHAHDFEEACRLHSLNTTHLPLPPFLSLHPILLKIQSIKETCAQGYGNYKAEQTARGSHFIHPHSDTPHRRRLTF